MTLKKFIAVATMLLSFGASAEVIQLSTLTPPEARACQEAGKEISIENYKLNSTAQDLEIQRSILIKEHAALEKARENVSAETLAAYNISVGVYNFKAREFSVKLHEFSLQSGTHREAVAQFSASCSMKIIPQQLYQEICKAPIYQNDILCLSLKK